MLTVNLPQGECDFQMDWHVEQLYLKVTLPLCNTEGVEILCVNVQWANPLGINTPCVTC